jgi:sialic acid synthase SpsE
LSASNPFIIAEAGSSGGGKLDAMYECIRVAHRAGADAVKFQWMSSPDRVAARMSAPEARDTYAKYQWPADWLPKLSEYAHVKELEFLVTVDLPEDLPVVAPFVDRFKYASWAATDHDFLAASRWYDKRKIVSTGLCDLAEVEALAVHLCPGDAVLHCVSAYPTPFEEANLLAIRGLWTLDDTIEIGYSDHTANPLTGALAVAAGAKVLEVHFRLDDTPPDNPDYMVSHTPAGLRSYIWLARRAAEAMGDGVKKVQPSEAKNVKHRYATG